MFFKLIKSLIFLTLIGGVSFYIASNNNDHKDKVTSRQNLENSAKLIKYTIKFRNGILNLEAEKASIEDFSNISLKNMIANFSKDCKNIKIVAGKCNLKTKLKKAYLSEKLNVTSDNEMNLVTESAIIDWENGTISGNSKISGVKNNVKFTADGFSVKEDGKILLKHAKIIKDH